MKRVENKNDVIKIKLDMDLGYISFARNNEDY